MGIWVLALVLGSFASAGVTQLANRGGSSLALSIVALFAFVFVTVCVVTAMETLAPPLRLRRIPVEVRRSRRR